MRAALILVHMRKREKSFVLLKDMRTEVFHRHGFSIEMNFNSL